MVLYLNLFLGHLLGDFVLQPGWLVVAKRRGPIGLLGHVGVVTLCTTAILYSDLRALWPVVLFVALAHLGIEIVTIRARHDRTARGLFVFALDQTLHLASLGIPVVVLGGWTQAPAPASFGHIIPVGQLTSIAAMATVVFLGSILVFEAAETAVPRKEGTVLPLDAARLAGMVERGVALAAGLTAGPLAIAVPFIPRALLAFRLQPKDRVRQVIIAATGLALCAVTYAIVIAVTAAASNGTL